MGCEVVLTKCIRYILHVSLQVIWRRVVMSKLHLSMALKLARVYAYNVYENVTCVRLQSRTMH